MNRSVSFLAVLAICINGSIAHAESSGGKPQWEQSGDALQWGIPLVGLGLTFLLNSEGDDSGWLADPQSWTASLGGSPQATGFDWPGPSLGRSPRQDFLVSFLRMEVTTYALKYAIDADRPNGGSQSFPSGHTAAAFMGAEFIRKEYGWQWGVPALAAASWVGYTRVRSDNHYWRDVIAGAAIGVVSNHDFAEFDTKLGNLSITPTLASPSDFSTLSDPSGRWVRSNQEEFALVPALRFELRF